jgi:hypothetical protein
VSEVVPAMLTLIGLMVVYLIGKGLAKAMVAGIAVSLFSANLLVGSLLGSAARDRYERTLAGVDFQKAKAVQEMKIRLIRESLGLPVEGEMNAGPSEAVDKKIDK